MRLRAKLDEWRVIWKMGELFKRGLEFLKLAQSESEVYERLAGHPKRGLRGSVTDGIFNEFNSFGLARSGAEVPITSDKMQYVNLYKNEQMN